MRSERASQRAPASHGPAGMGDPTTQAVAKDRAAVRQHYNWQALCPEPRCDTEEDGCSLRLSANRAAP